MAEAIVLTIGALVTAVLIIRARRRLFARHDDQLERMERLRDREIERRTRAGRPGP